MVLHWRIISWYLECLPSCSPFLLLYFSTPVRCWCHRRRISLLHYHTSPCKANFYQKIVRKWSFRIRILLWAEARFRVCVFLWLMKGQGWALWHTMLSYFIRYRHPISRSTVWVSGTLPDPASLWYILGGSRWCPQDLCLCHHWRDLDAVIGSCLWAAQLWLCAHLGNEPVSFSSCLCLSNIRQKFSLILFLRYFPGFLLSWYTYMVHM